MCFRLLEYNKNVTGRYVNNFVVSRYYQRHKNTI